MCDAFVLFFLVDQHEISCVKIWHLRLHMQVGVAHMQMGFKQCMCACRLLATAPPQEIEKAQKLLDEVKAMFAEPAKSDKDVQALQQLIPVK